MLVVESSPLKQRGLLLIDYRWEELSSGWGEGQNALGVRVGANAVRKIYALPVNRIRAGAY